MTIGAAVATAILLLLAPALARAQDFGVAERILETPCAQVLRMGSDRYLKHYQDRSGDLSDAGTRGALGRYAQCRREANEALARRTLPAKRRTQVKAVHDALADLSTACIEMSQYAGGGGTMYLLFYSGAYVAREDFMKMLIEALARPGKAAPAARTKVASHVARAQRILASVANTPTPDWQEDPKAIQEYRQRFRTSHKQATQAAARLKTLLAALPDEPARMAAAHMERSVKNGIDFGPEAP